MLPLPTNSDFVIIHLFFFCIFADEEIGKHSRLQGWRDVGEGDIKIFLAHLIAMGLVRKGCMEKYWDHGETVKMPLLECTWGETLFRPSFLIYRFRTKV